MTHLHLNFDCPPLRPLHLLSPSGYHHFVGNLLRLNEIPSLVVVVTTYPLLVAPDEDEVDCILPSMHDGFP